MFLIYLKKDLSYPSDVSDSKIKTHVKYNMTIYLRCFV